MSFKDVSSYCSRFFPRCKDCGVKKFCLEAVYDRNNEESINKALDILEKEVEKLIYKEKNKNENKKIKEEIF